MKKHHNWRISNTVATPWHNIDAYHCHSIFDKVPNPIQPRFKNVLCIDVSFLFYLDVKPACLLVVCFKYIYLYVYQFRQTGVTLLQLPFKLKLFNDLCNTLLFE